MRRPNLDLEARTAEFRAYGSDALLDIARERRRQSGNEGYSAQHDDEHRDGSLAQAAGCYALPSPELRTRIEYEYPGRGECDRPVQYPDTPALWPQSWHARHWKPKDRRRDLVRAAALLVAEIERLDRVEPTYESAMAREHGPDLNRER